MHTRENALNDWLKTIFKNEAVDCRALAGDASFRRYWRIQANTHPYVLMDAPPEKEALIPFIEINLALKAHGIHTPQLFESNLEEGFLLLEDLGSQSFLDALMPSNAWPLYQNALDVLGKMQTCTPIHYPLPAFDKTHMLNEMSLFLHWYWQIHLQMPADKETTRICEESFHWIANEISQLPQVFIHRDYHSRNIMIMNNRSGIELGIIDFQDAMRGPIGYDFVSLLKDCYIEWPEAFRTQCLAYFYDHHAKPYLSFEAFEHAVLICGIQRHLKVLGIFSRLHHRDQKSGYLKDLPLTLRYLKAALKQIEPLTPLLNMLVDRT